MTSQAMWMVRAGEGGLAIEAFRAESVVAIGWVDLGDLSALKTRADFTRAAAREMQRLVPLRKVDWPA